MPRSDEAHTFICGVYMAVQEIPYGKVTTYGHIARLVGKPQCPRQVGQALKHLPISPTSHLGETNEFYNGNVPWQRVIAADGKIPVREDPTGVQRHVQMLQAEGVDVQQRAGGWYVVFGSEGWFPRRLPSDGEGRGDESDDEFVSDEEDEEK